MSEAESGSQLTETSEGLGSIKSNVAEKDEGNDNETAETANVTIVTTTNVEVTVEPEVEEGESRVEVGESGGNNDLENPTSDTEDIDDETGSEGEEDGTCSRSRPYVRGQKSVVKAEESITDKTLPMPTPDESEPQSITTTVTSLKCLNNVSIFVTPSEKCKSAPVNILDSTKSELSADCISNSNNGDAIKISPEKEGSLQGRDLQSENLNDESSSSGNKASSERPAIASTPAKTSPTAISPPPMSLGIDTDRQNLTKDVMTTEIQLPYNKDKRTPNITSSDSATANSCHTTSNATIGSNSATTVQTITTSTTSGSRKGSKIPVGIAVAWQRLVTSNSALQNSTASVTSSAPSNSMSKPKDRDKHIKSDLPYPLSPVKGPSRPSSASPVSISPGISIKAKDDKLVKRSSVLSTACASVGVKSDGGSGSKRLTPDLSRGPVSVATASRPVPSSSVPPNLGLPYFHHASLLDYHYGMRSLTSYPSLESHPHHNGHFSPTWQSPTEADLSVPQGFASPGAAAYLQQTMHNQLQLQQHIAQQSYGSSPSLSYLHPGYETLRHQYEQLILHNHHQQQQRQHSELLRQYQYHQNQQLLAGSASFYEGLRATPTFSPSGSGSPRISIPILSPSPTGGVRTPTPTTTVLNPSHHSLSLSNLSAISTAGLTPPTPNWPELYHHGSSAALSPKSLTSSSPSPVTVQQQQEFSQSGSAFGPFDRSGSGGPNFGRKCATPNPTLSRSLPLNASLKERENASTKSQVTKKHLSMSRDKHLDDKEDGSENAEKRARTNTPQDLTQRPQPHPNVTCEQVPPRDRISENELSTRKHDSYISTPSPSPSPMSPSSSQHRHDFTRLESLIEKRAQDDTSNAQEENRIKDYSKKSVHKEQNEDVTDNSVKICGMEKVSKMGEDVKSFPVKVETNLGPKQVNLKSPIVKSESVVNSATSLILPAGKLNKKTGLIKTESKSKTKKIQVPSNECKKRVPVAKRGGKDKSQLKTNTCPQERVKKPKEKKVQKDELPETNVKPRNSKTKSEKSKPKTNPKQSKKSKELESSRPLSCDLFITQTNVKTSEDYKGKIVPDSNLPVAASMCNLVTNSSNANLRDLGLSPLPHGEKVVLNGGAVVLPLNGKVKKERKSPKEPIGSNPAPKGKKKEKNVPVEKVVTAQNLTNSTSSKFCSESNPDNNNIVMKHEKLSYGSGKMRKDDNRKSSVIIQPNLKSEVSGTSPTVIFTSPKSIPGGSGGNPVSLNPVTLSSSISPGSVSINPTNNTGSLVLQNSNPVIPIPYHNSPVTLILPRILPQTTITNSHHQTSFKLVMSSQEIKIPAFVPSLPNMTIEGTTQTFQVHQEHLQNFSGSTSLQNVNAMASTTVSSSSVLVTPCDSDITSSDNDNSKRNTITFIGDVYPNGSLEIQPSSYQIRQNYLPHQNNIVKTEEPRYIEPVQIHHQNQTPQKTYFQQNQTQSSNIFIRKDFIEPEDNHLNLLATVAQEFGSRDDLGKLVSSSGSNLIGSIGSGFHSNSNSSRGSSLMTSPTLSMQSPEVNFPTPSSTTSNNTTVSISLPSSPNAKFNSLLCKSPYDEYEYDEKEQVANEVSPGSYKHPVWLKIPHIVPQAANKVAEKLKKAQRKQEKATNEQPKSPKKKRDTNLPRNVSSDNSPSGTKAKAITKRDKGSIAKKARTNSNVRKGCSSDKGESRNSKIKIPKIPLTNLSKEQPGPKSLSPKKTKSRDNVKHSSEQNTEGQFNMKMTIPVPKVAKIRIKLSETEEPTLLHRHSESTVYDKTTKKINRRHSDGDKLKVGKNKYANDYSSHDDKSLTFNTDSDLSHHNHKNKPYNKPKNHEQGDKRNGLALVSPKVYKPIRNKPDSTAISPRTKSSGDLLLSSFTSLTPPPTARPLEHSSPLGHTRPSTFSPNLPNESDRKVGNDFNANNWMSGATFATSTIRVSNSANYTHSFGQTDRAGKEYAKNATGGDSDRMDVDKSGVSDKKDKRKRDKPCNLSLINIFPNQTQPIGNDKGESKNNEERDIKPELKSFVTYTPKTAKSPHRHHHIKPCLKAEPVVRPRPQSSSDEENSDADIDFEVATLTNSIPRNVPSLLQQYRNNRKKSSQAEAKAAKNVDLNQNVKRRLSTSHRKGQKYFGRRLSLNLETGRTREESEEEELPDIGGDYSTVYPQKHHQRSVHAENENKQSSNNKQGAGGGRSRRGSGGSASTSASSSCLAKRLPKRRSARSLTNSSTSGPADRLGLISSAKSSEFGRGRDSKADVHEDETRVPGKIELESVAELLDEMRILTEIQGLFYTGKLNALQPPDVYGVTLDNERGAPPHLIFSAEEVLEKCIREKKPRILTVGLRICAYWSPQYSGLYPGRVSTDFNPSFDPEKDLIPIEFDDGDTGMIKLAEIRTLPANHPIREYDPNPLLTLEKKHRKRRHSSANTNSGACTGDHEEADCGESYCAKVAKFVEEDDELKDTHHPYKTLYWTWTGLGYKRPKSKKNRNKEFFHGIQREDEVINVGDSAIFISHGNERPYIGRIEKFWEKKGQKIVNVRWFYHPEEVKSPKRIPYLKHPGALFESPHIDENDVQTIAKKCDVIPFPEFKERIGRLPKLSLKNSDSSTKPRDLYYICGYYDPYTYNLQLKI